MLGLVLFRRITGKPEAKVRPNVTIRIS